MATVVTIAGIDRTCDVADGMRVSVGRVTVRDKGEPSTAALTLRVDPALPFVAPFDPVEITYHGLVRFKGTVAEATLEHSPPGADPAAYQRIAAVGPLASWGTAAVGDEPWPQETVAERAARVAALIEEPLVVQGGTEQQVVRLDVDNQRAVQIIDALADSVGGWVFDFAGTVYLQSLDARKVQTGAEAWADEPVGAAWDALDPSVTWLSEDWNPYLPLDIPGCYVRWAPLWASTSEVATAVRMEYGRPADWEAPWTYVQSQGSPAAGELAMNNVAEIAVSHTDADGADRGPDLATIVPGTVLRFANQDFTVSTATDESTHHRLIVVPATRPADTGRHTVAFKYAQPSLMVQDTEAIARYGRREIKLSSQLAENADAAELAYLVLSRSKEPFMAFPTAALDIARMPYQLAAELLAARPGVRVTIHDLPQPAPARAFTGVIEGWEETYAAGGAHLVELHVSDISQSLAVPTWSALPFDALWSDEPVGEPWEAELIS